jgi:hypothetical protein
MARVPRQFESCIVGRAGSSPFLGFFERRLGLFEGARATLLIRAAQCVWRYSHDIRITPEEA